MDMNSMLSRDYSGKPNGLQKSIDQIGIGMVEAMRLPVGFCEMHGHYIDDSKNGIQMNTKDTQPIKGLGCPTCAAVTADGNGTTASEVELYIDIKDAIQCSSEF